MSAEGGGVAEERGAALAGVGAHQTTIDDYDEGGTMTTTAAAPKTEDPKVDPPVDPPAVAEKATGQITRTYIVLKQTPVDTDVTFKRVGEYVAHGDKPAIKAAVDEHGFGTYVAVSKSGWHQHTRERVQEERVRWS